MSTSAIVCSVISSLIRASISGSAARARSAGIGPAHGVADQVRQVRVADASPARGRAQPRAGGIRARRGPMRGLGCGGPSGGSCVCTGESPVSALAPPPGDPLRWQTRRSLANVWPGAKPKKRLLSAVNCGVAGPRALAGDHQRPGRRLGHVAARAPPAPSATAPWPHRCRRRTA